MKSLCLTVVVLLIASTASHNRTIAKDEMPSGSLTRENRSVDLNVQYDVADSSIPPRRERWSSLLLHNTTNLQHLPEAGEIVTARERVRNYVLDVKEKFKPSDQEYKEARKLFRNAAAEYAGWVTDVKLAILNGKTRDLRKDEQYKQKSERAGQAVKAFVDYAQSVTTESRSILPFVSMVADIGIKIWTVRKDRRAKERAAFADAFEKEVRWQTWEDITTKTEKPD